MCYLLELNLIISSAIISYSNRFQMISIFKKSKNATLVMIYRDLSSNFLVGYHIPQLEAHGGPW